MEEVLPPQTESGAGFEPTRVRQITVFLDNRVGRLQTLVRAYEEAGGRIMSLSIQNSADTALVRLICSEADLARDAGPGVHPKAGRALRPGAGSLRRARRRTPRRAAATTRRAPRS